MNIGRFARPLIRDAFYSSQTVFEKAVRGALDGPRNVGVRRAAIGRVIFEAAILGRVVRRRDHDAVGKTIGAALVGGEDRMRDHRRRRIAVMRVDHHLDAVGRKYFERARLRRLRQGMGVDADE